MTFREVLEKLGIEDFEQQILQSNSHGELFHIGQYFELAEHYPIGAKWFRLLFIQMVDKANLTWERPESVYQHIKTIFLNGADLNEKSPE